MWTVREETVRGNVTATSRIAASLPRLPFQISHPHRTRPLVGSLRLPLLWTPEIENEEGIVPGTEIAIEIGRREVMNGNVTEAIFGKAETPCRAGKTMHADILREVDLDEAQWTSCLHQGSRATLARHVRQNDGTGCEMRPAPRTTIEEVVAEQTISGTSLGHRLRANANGLKAS